MNTHDKYTMIDLKPSARPNATRPSIRSIQIVREHDSLPNLSHLADPDLYTGLTPEETAEYMQQDRARLAAYNAGHWHMLGIYAQAAIAIPMGENCACLQTIKSPGLWGIESDSDDSHFQETAADQLAELRTILSALNVDLATWPASISTRGE